MHVHNQRVRGLQEGIMALTVKELRRINRLLSNLLAEFKGHSASYELFSREVRSAIEELETEQKRLKDKTDTLSRVFFIARGWGCECHVYAEGVERCLSCVIAGVEEDVAFS